ncbi:MAG: glycosyltransferase [Gemmatimonadota bacterium]
MSHNPEFAVVHVCAPAAAGGLETVVRQLARGQQAAGMRVLVLAIVDPSPVDHPFVSTLIQDGIAARAVRVPSRRYLSERRQIRDELTRFQPAVVHTHGYRVDLVDAPVARRIGAATVSTVHGFTGGDWKNRLYETAQRRALRRMDAVVAVSEPMWAGLKTSGVSADRLHLVPNELLGFEPHPRPEARRRLGIPLDQPAIGWIGRLSREKGPDVLVEAVALQADGAVRVIVIGDGPERGSLEVVARDRGVADRIVFMGQIPAAGRLVKAFDLVVLSSRTEGTPMVLLEALQAGVPVVATGVGGIPGAAGGRATLVPADDPGALSVAMAAMLERPSPAAHSAPRSPDNGPGWISRYEAVYRAAEIVRDGRTGSR